MLFTVTDDSGFLGLIDPDAYEGFVGEGWTYDSLFEHFAAQMKRRTLLIWATSGHGGFWTVSTEGAIRGARSVAGPITSSRGRLCFVNYETLSMAAQFADVRLPERHMADLEFAVGEGTFTCTVTQVHDDDSRPAPQFGVEVGSADAPLEPWAGPAWFDPSSGSFEPLDVDS